MVALLDFPTWRGAGLVLALLLGGPVAGHAQQAPRPFWAVKTVPQYVVVSGFWLEVERGLRRHPRQSFTLAPQLYHGPAGRPNLS